MRCDDRLTFPMRNVVVKSEYGLNGDSVLPAIDKLGQMEDVGESMGLDPLVALKALRDGVWAVRGGKAERAPVWAVSLHSVITVGRAYLPFDEYGKTWALTKEELE